METHAGSLSLDSLLVKYMELNIRFFCIFFFKIKLLTSMILLNALFIILCFDLRNAFVILHATKHRDYIVSLRLK